MTRSDFERELKRIGLPRPSGRVDRKILAEGARNGRGRAAGERENADGSPSGRALLAGIGRIATLSGVAALLILSLVHFFFGRPGAPDPDPRAGQTPQEKPSGPESPESTRPYEAPRPVILHPAVIDLCQGTSRDGRIPARTTRDITRGLAAICRADPEVDRALKELAYAYRFRAENADRLGLELPAGAAERVKESLRAAGKAAPDPARGDPGRGPFPVSATGIPALDRLNERYGVKAFHLHPKHPGCVELEFTAPLDTWRLARVYEEALGPEAPGSRAQPVFRVPRDDRRDRRRGRYLVDVNRRAGQLDLDVYFETRPGQVHRRRFSYHPETDQVSRVRPVPEPVATRMDAVMLAVDWNRCRPSSRPSIKPEDMDRALFLLHEERPDLASYRPVPDSGFPPIGAAYSPRRMVTLAGGEECIRFYFRDLSSGAQIQTSIDSPFGRR